jgi:cytochrome c peroxidase
MNFRLLKISTIAVFVLSIAFFISGCGKPIDDGGYKPDIQPIPPGLATYEAMTIPADNPMTPEKIALGKQLYFDERLSVDSTRSCYSCHVCEKGLTDGLPKAIGALNKQLPRSSPTLWNIGYHKEFYWDGRSASLEKQAMAAWQGGNMGAKDKEAEIVGRFNALAGYRVQFQKVFGSDATPENIMMAISAFERTITSGDTAWDKFRAGNESALSAEAKRGWQVFQDVKCTNCHDGVLLTDQQYHNVGVGMDKPEPDKGRFTKSNNPQDTGAFKTPTLRDVAESAPYFHDGSVATLEEAVDFMLGGGKDNPYLDKKNLEKREITKEQRADLIAFLKALDVDCKLTKPALPQK